MGNEGRGLGSEETAGGNTAHAESVQSPSSEATAWLEVAFQASSGALALLTGPELRYALVNASFGALCPDLGAELLGRRFEDAKPVTTENLGGVLQEVLASGTTAEGETQVIDGSGRQRWFAYLVRRMEGSAAPAVLVELRENTVLVQARWAAEAAADAAGRHVAELEGIMEAIPEGVMVFDRAGEIVRMNAAASESWRAAGIDLAGSSLAAFSQFELRGEDGRPVPQSEWPVWRALAGERVHGVHLRCAPQGARPIWMLASAAPIRDAAGRVTGAVLSFSDETALHELAEARDDLIRMVSHDLRTPLSAIYAQAHLIRRSGEAAARIVERAAIIERSCERMSGMIQDLVEVTLLEAGQLSVTLTRVDVAALVPDILQGMRGGLAVERVRLKTGPACWANLDPARFERVVVNLVSNALKYSAQEVDVTLECAGGTVALSVTDTGVGISAEDQSRIFERYYRAQGHRRPEGLGLGLYITRLLVEGMGGRVEVESRLGQGSTFRVLFPAAAGSGPG